jgi:hypothetical protein
MYSFHIKLTTARGLQVTGLSFCLAQLTTEFCLTDEGKINHKPINKQYIVKYNFQNKVMG